MTDSPAHSSTMSSAEEPVIPMEEFSEVDVEQFCMSLYAMKLLSWTLHECDGGYVVLVLFFLNFSGGHMQNGDEHHWGGERGPEPGKGTLIHIQLRDQRGANGELQVGDLR